jgi:hypothetical protein
VRCPDHRPAEAPHGPESDPDANRLTDIIDLKQAGPAHVAGPPLPQGAVDLGGGKVAETGNQGKMYVSAVLMPDGKVLETGGALHNRVNPVHESSIFDPDTSTYDLVAADSESSGYHSSAFLLPDDPLGLDPNRDGVACSWEP